MFRQRLSDQKEGHCGKSLEQKDKLGQNPFFKWKPHWSCLNLSPLPERLPRTSQKRALKDWIISWEFWLQPIMLGSLSYRSIFAHNDFFFFNTQERYWKKTRFIACKLLNKNKVPYHICIIGIPLLHILNITTTLSPKGNFSLCLNFHKFCKVYIAINE